MHPMQQKSSVDITSGNVVWQSPGQEAIEALDHLWDRTFRELADYVSHVRESSDQGRQGRADWVRHWLETEGARIRCALSSRIRRSKVHDQEKMQASILAAENLVEIARKRDLDKMEHWDLILSWVEDVLPSVEDAFDLFAERVDDVPLDEFDEGPWKEGDPEGDLEDVVNNTPLEGAWTVPEIGGLSDRFDDVAA